MREELKKKQERKKKAPRYARKQKLTSMRFAADIVLPALVQPAKVHFARRGVGPRPPDGRGERLALPVPKVPHGKGDDGVVGAPRAATAGCFLLEGAVDDLDPAAVRVGPEMLPQLVAARGSVGAKGPREERGAGGVVGEGGVLDGGEAVGVGLAGWCQVQRHCHLCSGVCSSVSWLRERLNTNYKNACEDGSMSYTSKCE